MLLHGSILLHGSALLLLHGSALLLLHGSRVASSERLALSLLCMHSADVLALQQFLKLAPSSFLFSALSKLRIHALLKFV